MEQENISLIIDFDDTLVDVNAAKVRILFRKIQFV